MCIQMYTCSCTRYTIHNQRYNICVCTNVTYVYITCVFSIVTYVYTHVYMYMCLGSPQCMYTCTCASNSVIL